MVSIAVKQPLSFAAGGGDRKLGVCTMEFIETPEITTHDQDVEQPAIKRFKTDHVKLENEQPEFSQNHECASSSEDVVSAIESKLSAVQSGLDKLDQWHVQAQTELEALKDLLNHSFDVKNTESNVVESKFSDQKPVDRFSQLWQSLQNGQHGLDALFGGIFNASIASPASLLSEFDERRQELAQQLRCFVDNAGRILDNTFEPPRFKTHLDYLLTEMSWMATDFERERQWKMSIAKIIAKEVQFLHILRNTSMWQQLKNDYPQLAAQLLEQLPFVRHRFHSKANIYCSTAFPHANASNVVSLSSDHTQSSCTEVPASGTGINSGSALSTGDIVTQTRFCDPVLSSDSATSTALPTPSPHPTAENPKIIRLLIQPDFVDPTQQCFYTFKDDDNLTEDESQLAKSKVFRFLSRTSKPRLNLQEREQLYRLFAEHMRAQGFIVSVDVAAPPFLPGYDELALNTAVEQPLPLSSSSDQAKLFGPMINSDFDSLKLQLDTPPANLLPPSACSQRSITIEQDGSGNAVSVRIPISRIARYRKRGVICAAVEALSVTASASNTETASDVSSVAAVASQFNGQSFASPSSYKLQIVTSGSFQTLPLLSSGVAGSINSTAPQAINKSIKTASSKSNTHAHKVAVQTPLDLPWTSGEDNLLMSLVSAYGSNWIVVHHCLANQPRVFGRLRTARDCQARWNLLHELRQRDMNGDLVGSTVMHAGNVETQVKLEKHIKTEKSASLEIRGSDSLLTDDIQNGKKKEPNRTLTKKSKTPIGLRNENGAFLSGRSSREPIGFGGGLFNAINAATVIIRKELLDIHSSLKAAAPPSVTMTADQQHVQLIAHESHSRVLVEAHNKWELPSSAIGKTLMPSQLINLRDRREVTRNASIAAAAAAAAQQRQVHDAMGGVGSRQSSNSSQLDARTVPRLLQQLHPVGAAEQRMMLQQHQATGSMHQRAVSQTLAASQTASTNIAAPSGRPSHGFPVGLAGPSSAIQSRGISSGSLHSTQPNSFVHPTPSPTQGLNPLVPTSVSAYSQPAVAGSLPFRITGLHSGESCTSAPYPNHNINQTMMTVLQNGKPMPFQSPQ